LVAEDVVVDGCEAEGDGVVSTLIPPPSVVAEELLRPIAGGLVLLTFCPGTPETLFCLLLFFDRTLVCPPNMASSSLSSSIFTANCGVEDDESWDESAWVAVEVEVGFDL
jgi:hypothetical protein